MDHRVENLRDGAFLVDQIDAHPVVGLGLFDPDVGHQRKPGLGSESPIDLAEVRKVLFVVGDGDGYGIETGQFLITLLQLTELRIAGRSPVRPVHDQDDVLLAQVLL